jgi:hypothetical protein
VEFGHHEDIDCWEEGYEEDEVDEGFDGYEVVCL